VGLVSVKRRIGVVMWMRGKLNIRWLDDEQDYPRKHRDVVSWWE
jgi:hypothetical protein